MAHLKLNDLTAKPSWTLFQATVLVRKKLSRDHGNSLHHETCSGKYKMCPRFGSKALLNGSCIAKNATEDPTSRDRSDDLSAEIQDTSGEAGQARQHCGKGDKRIEVAAIGYQSANNRC